MADMTDMVSVRIDRVYSDVPESAGTRVLADRLWPRGLRKESAPVDLWCREIAPSTDLRKWFGHRPEKAGEFADRYRAELDDADHADALAQLRDLVANGPVILLTATKGMAVSHLPVLAGVLGGNPPS